jgi:hypothetical protein
MESNKDLLNDIPERNIDNLEEVTIIMSADFKRCPIEGADLE